ncbi:hypothetical protein [Herbiconiux ginsengi]|uniref:Uncharacterized protein n=1 Tax=Herbiconiux ginsengi TaxID=381665 RepID=A0A1H3TQD9_9MICO|nr:hypothetical protein [Herbiconiux ginsengi]SDZ52330.1 hypothetical protein SAMN05216554_4388 [Herbiconiux ginsengi]
MRSPGSTVVVVVGSVTDVILRELGRLPNVQALRLTEQGAPTLREVLGAASRPFLVHDLDPLAAVAAAWRGFYDDPSTLSLLRVETESALTAFAAGESVLPDYYLVLDPEGIDEAESQWWLGVLAAIAPSRVLPVEAATAAVQRMLGALPTGRAWPDPAGWLRELHLQVPDRAGLL